MSNKAIYKLPRTLKQRARDKKSRWTEDEVDRAYFRYEEDLVGDAIRSLPVRGPCQPGNDPEMPGDITTFTNSQIGMLRSQFVAQCEWLDWEVAKAALEATKAEAYLKHVYATVHLQKSGTVDDKKSKATQDNRYAKEEVEAFKATARAKLLRARLEGYDRCANDLSREQTRREKELERTHV